MSLILNENEKLLGTYTYRSISPKKTARKAYYLKDSVHVTDKRVVFETTENGTDKDTIFRKEFRKEEIAHIETFFYKNKMPIKTILGVLSFLFFLIGAILIAFFIEEYEDALLIAGAIFIISGITLLTIYLKQLFSKVPKIGLKLYLKHRLYLTGFSGNSFLIKGPKSPGKYVEVHFYDEDAKKLAEEIGSLIF